MSNNPEKKKVYAKKPSTNSQRLSIKNRMAKAREELQKRKEETKVVKETEEALVKANEKLKTVNTRSQKNLITSEIESIKNELLLKGIEVNQAIEFKEQMEEEKSYQEKKDAFCNTTPKKIISPLSDVLLESRKTKFSSNSFSGSQEFIKKIKDGFQCDDFQEDDEDIPIKEIDFSSIGIDEKYTPDKKSYDTFGSHATFLKGRRLFSFENFEKFLDSYADHIENCGKRPQFTGEYRSGLYSVCNYYCFVCNRNISLSNSEGRDIPSFFDSNINYCALLGCLSNGIGRKAFNDILALLDIPGLTSKCYKHVQFKVEKYIDEYLDVSITGAINEEKDNALVIDSFDKDGKPGISAVGDAGWSKRSYRSSYTANSAAAVLIGAHSKKILYVGVKNKYCSVCQSYINKDSGKEHICFKNWSVSSTSMESALILDGFKYLDEKYDTRIIKYIGDADSSVNSSLQSVV